MLIGPSDLFPTRQTQTYEYEAFAMELPHRPQEGLVNVVEDAPNFQIRFYERYVVSSEGMTATSMRNGVEVSMAFRMLPAGLFVLDRNTQEERCIIPLPLERGVTFTDHYGTTRIEDVKNGKLWVVEIFKGDVRGYAKTCYAQRAWVLYQEVKTDKISYVVRQIEAPV